MCTKCITFLVGLTLIASTSIISRPFLDNSQEPPLIFSEISKSRFLNNSDLIQKIIRDDNECLYTLHHNTTPVEYAIYFKAWPAVEILLALDQKEPLITRHGHQGNPLIHMMIEQNAPYLLLKSALQIQPNFCFSLNPQQETALETLIKKDDNPDCA